MSLRCGSQKSESKVSKINPGFKKTPEGSKMDQQSPNNLFFGF